MNSITKTNISNEKIVEVVKKTFGQNTTIHEIKELKEGFFNTAYLLTIKDKQKVILKISPPKDVKVMRYEKGIMANEVYAINKICLNGAVPIPRVLYYDSNRDIIENEYFFMEFIQGSPLNNIYDELTEKQRNTISSELGKYAKHITSIKAEYFGDISKKDKQFKTWSEAFLFMIKELLDDAKDNKVQLPYDYDEIYQMIENNRNVLDMVKKAALVHKDLWKGNIFVDIQTAKIQGIIDFERAVYGDILLEPVCGFLLKDTSFMNSFIGRTYLDKDEQLRSILYRIYLFLIMVIECSFRKYSWENSDKWAREQLGEAV
ncbi:MAG: phosphotransferase family protein, partial [Ruminiclostridium sp.]